MGQLKVYNPYTKEAIGSINQMGEEELEKIVAQAKEAFKVTRILSTLERKKL